MKYLKNCFVLFMILQISYCQQNSVSDDDVNPYLIPFRDAAVATKLKTKAFPKILQTHLDSFVSDLLGIMSKISEYGYPVLKSTKSALGGVIKNLDDYVVISLEGAANRTSEEVLNFIDKAVSILDETDDRVDHLYNVFSDYINTELAELTDSECYKNIRKKLNSTARNVFKSVFTCATDRADEVYNLIANFETHLLKSDEQIKASVLSLEACIDGLSVNATDLELNAIVSCVLPLASSTIETHNALCIQTSNEASNISSIIQNISNVTFPECSGLMNTVNQFDVYEIKNLVESCKALPTAG